MKRPQPYSRKRLTISENNCCRIGKGGVGYTHRSEQRDDQPPNNKTMQHHFIASANFSKKTLNKLAKANLFIVSSTFIPGPDGSYANGESAYLLSDGTMKSFLQVLALA